jgi:hypothetical protein
MTDEAPTDHKWKYLVAAALVVVGALAIMCSKAADRADHIEKPPVCTTSQANGKTVDRLNNEVMKLCVILADEPSWSATMADGKTRGFPAGRKIAEDCRAGDDTASCMQEAIEMYETWGSQKQ